MSKPVLFVTGLGRNLDRAENLKALYDAYNGEKKFVSSHDMCYSRELYSGKYGLIIVDIFPVEHPVKTVLIWHAIQGGKYIGLDEKTTYYKRSYADCMDYIIVAGTGGIDMFNQCTGVSRERILDFGMPRTDRYFKRRKRRTDSKRTYLYAPTFRNWRETPLPMIDWEWLDKQLTDDERLVIKSHPLGYDEDPMRYKHIAVASKMAPSVDYLFDCDVLITDYSSIMFDAYLLKKPVVLFEKNPGYVQTRGMYLKYPDEYCSRYARNEHELLEQIRSANRLRTAERKCIEYVADACDGHSCERICRFIDEIKE